MSVTKRILGRAASGTGRTVSIENYEEGISPEDMAQAQQLQIDQNSALEDLQQIDSALMADEPEGDVLSEAVGTYPKVVEMIERDIEDNGGISTESAKYVNFILEQAGLSGIVNVSVESFGDNKTRLSQSKVSMEGIKETLRQWWDNLLAWFAKMRDGLKKWWIKSFSTAATMKDRASNMSDRAKKITTSNPKEKKLSFGNLQSTLFVAGKFPGNALPGALKEMTNIGTTLFGDWQASGIKSAEEILEVVGSANLDTAGIAAFADTLSSKISEVIAFNPTGFTAVPATGDVPDDYGTNASANYRVTRTPELPGQRAVYLKQPGGGKNNGGKDAAGNANAGVAKLASTVEWLTNRVFKLDSYVKKPKDDTDTQIDTLTPTTVIEVCSEIETFATIVENYQRNFKAQEKANEDITKFKKIADQVPDENDRDVVQAQNLIKKLPKALSEMINEPVTQFGSQFFKTAQSALRVCERSLAQY